MPKNLSNVTTKKKENSRETYFRATCEYTLCHYGKLRIGRRIIGQQATIEAQDIMLLKHMDT
jgi:hypothetical protein